MTAKEVKEKETPALNEELTGLRRKSFDLRTQAVTEKVEDTSQYGKIRRDIARILTELNTRAKKAPASEQKK
jgi:large subunit ribosomal protein L29